MTAFQLAWNDMVNDQTTINEQIARMCGWEAEERDGCWRLANKHSVRGDKEGISEAHAWRFFCPDYCNSLDACREFEDKFDALELAEYAIHLRRIVTRNVERDSEPKNPDTYRIPDGRYYCATPHERCEALCSMRGVWHD